jgi:hypothetical protein
VIKPKLKARLGVLRLRLENDVLLMKNLYKFFTKADLPGVHLLWPKFYTNGQVPGEVRKCSLWWKSILMLLNMYKGMEQARVVLRRFSTKLYQFSTK